MGGMAGSVVTISPRIPLAELERRLRARLARDGVAVLAAASADDRQRRYLRKLRARLAGDPGLSVFYGDRLDGATWLTVCRAGEERLAAYFGDARTDRPDTG